MGVHLRKKGDRLYLDIYWKGYRKRESLGLRLTKDKIQNEEIYRIAEIIRKKRELQLISGNFGIPDPVGRKIPILEYAKTLAEGKKPGDHMARVVRYIEGYAGAIPLENITIRYVEGFKTYLANTGLSPQSQRHMFNALKRILDHAIREGILEQNPAKLIRSPKVPEKAPVFLELAELQSLANTLLQGELGQEVYRAFLFACFTGFRIGDIKTLTWGDVKREKRLILKEQQKTGKVVSIPLHPTAWRMIDPGDRIPGFSEPLFPKLSKLKSGVNEILKQWAKKAGIGKRIGWHTARKTYATLSMLYSGDYGTVSKLLGHTTVTVTARYAQILDPRKEKVAFSIPELPVPPWQIGK